MSTVTEKPNETQGIPSTRFGWPCVEYTDRTSWLGGRRFMLGSSDVAAILGHGYADQSTITIFDSKVNGERNESEEEFLLVGKDLEPGLLRIVNRKTGHPCESAGDFTIYRHPEIPWLGSTLDGVLHDPEFGPCPLELKNVSHFNKVDWQDEDAPLKFQIQQQQQLAVTGAKRGYLMGLIGGQKPVIRPIDRNDKFIDAMIKKCAEFWACVERNEIPPVDASAATKRILAKLWTEDTGKTIDLPQDSIGWAAELEQAKADKKDAEAREVAAHNLIAASIGDATFGVCPNGVEFSYKTQNKKEFMVKASSTRVLRRLAG